MFVPVPPETMREIAAGQNIGDCHGCEVEYGRKLHADLIARIKVQKVSNLILNMNVYMADVASQKMTFVHSVDIRGNTDESRKTYFPEDMRYRVRGAISEDLGQRSLFLLLLTASVELTLYSLFHFLKWIVTRKAAV